MTALYPATLSLAQNTAAPSANATAGRVLGTVTATGSGTVTVHPAAGPDVVVALTPATRLLRAAPGAKSLSTATPIAASDLAVGDRVLIRLSPGGDDAHPSAAILVAMKQADIEQTHAAQAAEWQQHGVSGIVASTDPSSGTITLSPRGAAPGLQIHTTSSTVFRRYAPTSTSFADAVPSTLAEIKPGDQLRARGARTGDEIAADEVVAGSFRNIAGTVEHTDTSADTLSLRDLATRQELTLHLDATTQLRKLPPFLAQRLAARARPGAHGGAQEAAQEPAQQTSEDHHGQGGRGGAENTEALLERAPVLQLGDLKKGDAVMVVASGPGAPQATAITVIAGVEPLLQGSSSSEGSSELFSASWNLGGGDASEAGGPQR